MAPALVSFLASIKSISHTYTYTGTFDDLINSITDSTNLPLQHVTITCGATSLICVIPYGGIVVLLIVFGSDSDSVGLASDLLDTFEIIICAICDRIVFGFSVSNSKGLVAMFNQAPVSLSNFSIVCNNSSDDL